MLILSRGLKAKTDNFGLICEVPENADRWEDTGRARVDAKKKLDPAHAEMLRE
jgi:hypothetical protein